MVRTRVLVVEDDKFMQEFYKHFFEVEHKDKFTGDWPKMAKKPWNGCKVNR